MSVTEQAAEALLITPIADMDQLEPGVRSQAISAYQEAFGPTSAYNESYTDDEAAKALAYSLTKGGDLLLGMMGGKVISFAAGFARRDGTYYIEELGVAPAEQGNGVGKAMLRALLDRPAAQAASRLEIRTTIRNCRAIGLYESEGFEREAGTEIAVQGRQDGRIAVDERVYLSKPPLPETERFASLKRVAVAYPSGNTTAIVFDQLLGVDRKSLNALVMRGWQSLQPGQAEVEQCCFVTLPRSAEALARVEMFGGEFCGNATRSVVWLLTKGADYRGLIEVSGVKRPLAFEVQDSTVAVEMPLPDDRSDLARTVDEGMLVQLDGIAQLVVTDPLNGQSLRDLLTELLRQNAYGLAAQPAVGVSYYDTRSRQAQFCVWVRAVDTIFDETACGSGTCAIGITQALSKQATVATDVVQPSGEPIRTEAVVERGTVARSVISGKVEVLYDGALELK